ncbi:hypothetical protein B0J13DRAFT_581507 [Dactylonectria estremocensis]|uniref:Uncharacterized protein n=1 Tax=Dactylonectria estremocensis TaxID=1079267 RepID=A0A9P9FBE8_9HYPO|nr:hypothetical protein B0J13DRAFT_581507 [Dactylonectria estremocensis]
MRATLTAGTLDPETFDPLIPQVAQQAVSKSPIRLPWQARILPLGMLFRSAATAAPDGGSNPFAPQSAFDAESLNSASIIFTLFDGSCSFRSSEAISLSASTDHLSVGVGAGFDMWALEASVSMHYDKDVMENRDSNKVSVLISYRASSVAFAHSPELSDKAFKILHSHGVDEFNSIKQHVLSSGSEKEIKRVKITVESCFGDYHEEESTSSTRTDQHPEVRFSAYSTIEQLIDSDTIHRRAQRLEDSVAEVLVEHGVRDGEPLTHNQCSQLYARECPRKVRHWTIAM